MDVSGGCVDIGVEGTEVSVNMGLCVFVPGGSVPLDSLQAVNNTMMKIKR